MNEKKCSKVRNSQRISPDTPNMNIIKKELAKDALKMRKQSDDEDLVETIMKPLNCD